MTQPETTRRDAALATATRDSIVSSYCHRRRRGAAPTRTVVMVVLVVVVVLVIQAGPRLESSCLYPLMLSDAG